MVKAHTTNLEKMLGYHDAIVTTSKLGTIRMWTARDLADEARRQGILHSTSSATSLHTMGITTAPMAFGRKGSAGQGESALSERCI